MPAALTLGITCAALLSHLLFASGKAIDDPRLAWLSVGTTLALIGLLLTLFALPSLFPGGGPVEQSADAGAARYLRLAPRADRRRGDRARRRGAEAPLPAHLRRPGCPPPRLGRRCFHPVRRPRVERGLLPHDARARRARSWPRRPASPSSGGGAPAGAVSWADMCVLAMMALAALDAFAYLVASEPYGGAWWASLALRAGQFAVPAVGLLIGFIAVAEKLREFEDELTANLVAERERARAAQERVDARRAAPRADPLAHADADRRRGPGRRVPADRRPRVGARGRCRGAGALPRRRRRRRSRPSAASSTRTRSTWACRSSWP